MSTFDGIVEEFPFIQIDYFRRNPSRPPPLACFLSHGHSDHLQGLESFRAPFIYCSAATRELLLRIEKYPHRMNFNKGVLESRRLHYKHLYKLLRPIPLNTPTEIELTPRLSIRVTLFDANHCAGAVMFLIEGDGKAVLYTGDIRAEPWWVNTLVRNPILIPYTLGGKRLDKIYLDTTFARADNVCHSFPSKADGLAELLQKVAKYPKDTVFYFRAWTFGYEEVWVALSAALNSRIHVDRYQLGLYRSVNNMQVRSSGNSATEAAAPALCGYELGNRFVPGCLSEDQVACRIHSCCESEPPCSLAKAEGTVHIEPIVSRLQDGSRLPEVGIGGGAGDLYQVHELELPDQTALNELEKLCHEQIQDHQVLSETTKTLLDAYKSKRKTLSLDEYGLKDEQDIPLDKLVRILSKGMRNRGTQSLPNRIEFPYSRHSSYSELCELVSAFSPRDVFPCTTNPLTWDENTSIRSLFGHLCSGTQFSHDIQMRHAIAHDEDLSRSRKRARISGSSPQSSQQSYSPRACSSFVSGREPAAADATLSSSSSGRGLLPSSLETISDPVPASNPEAEAERARRTEIRLARDFLQSNLPRGTVSLGPLPSWSDLDIDSVDTNTNTNTDNGPESQISIPESAFAASFSSQTHEHEHEHDQVRNESESARNRRAAYLAARADSFDAWNLVSLVSAGNNHFDEEIEL